MAIKTFAIGTLSDVRTQQMNDALVHEASFWRAKAEALQVQLESLFDEAEASGGIILRHRGQVIELVAKKSGVES